MTQQADQDLHAAIARLAGHEEFKALRVPGFPDIPELGWYAEPDLERACWLISVAPSERGLKWYLEKSEEGWQVCGKYDGVYDDFYPYDPAYYSTPMKAQIAAAEAWVKEQQ